MALLVGYVYMPSFIMCKSYIYTYNIYICIYLLYVCIYLYIFVHLPSRTLGKVMLLGTMGTMQHGLLQALSLYPYVTMPYATARQPLKRPRPHDGSMGSRNGIPTY